ncbi:MAG: hypothetical protein ABIH20_02090 [Candidatus Diapherotrites archaeon]
MQGHRFLKKVHITIGAGAKKGLSTKQIIDRIKKKFGIKVGKSTVSRYKMAFINRGIPEIKPFLDLFNSPERKHLKVPAEIKQKAFEYYTKACGSSSSFPANVYVSAACVLWEAHENFVKRGIAESFLDMSKRIPIRKGKTVSHIFLWKLNNVLEIFTKEERRRLAVIFAARARTGKKGHRQEMPDAIRKKIIDLSEQGKNHNQIFLYLRQNELQTVPGFTISYHTVSRLLNNYWDKKRLQS